jgi:hypothetical protein
VATSLQALGPSRPLPYHGLRAADGLPDEGNARTVDEIDVAARIKDDGVRSGAGSQAAELAAAQRPVAPEVAAASASSMVIPMSRTARAMQKLIEVVLRDPGSVSR